jgi:hypothetical protein
LLPAATYVGTYYYYPSELAAALPNEKGGFDHVRIPDFEFQKTSISQFRSIIDRPLFTSSRRPALVIQKLQIDSYRLRGVLVTSTGKIGLVEKIDDGTWLRVVEGSIVDEWQASSIEGNRITWMKLAQSNELAVSEMWEGGGASDEESVDDPSDDAVYGKESLNERANSEWHLSMNRDQTGGARTNRRHHGTHASGHIRIHGLVMPTAPLPPTPAAPRQSRPRRLSNPRGAP